MLYKPINIKQINYIFVAMSKQNNLHLKKKVSIFLGVLNLKKAKE